MSELVKAGVIASRAYIDQAGELHDKPARGRIYYLHMADWLRPAEPA
jgi:hypothetical protein